MDEPACLPFETVAAACGSRTVPEIFPALWCCGSLDSLARPTVAIVGTRAATAYGKALARRFAADLASAGCCIVSGLALGIDTEAHRGALDARRPTVGVLGSGHARFFPARNRTLAEQILAHGGAVLSPYAPGQPAQPHQFLERNGVVASLADAVVVIEAPARSGALNTAGWAAARIPVFAVPGDVDRPHVAGCHALIRDGAILARSAQDVLDDLRLGSPAPDDARGESPTPLADPLQRLVVDCLRSGEASQEELFVRCAASPPELLAALAMLEIGGTIEARPGQRYALRP